MEPKGQASPPAGVPVPDAEDLRAARVAETHISLLFFVGDRVYKLRKPVDFGFLDFSRRDTRRIDCEREVALNSRLAPDVYLGVADIAMNGQPLDHMVVMRRMPDERRLAAMARRGEDLTEALGQVAVSLARFHQEAPRSAEISAEATGTALLAGWNENFAETARFVGCRLDAAVDEEIRRLATAWLAGRAPLLDARIRAGRVRDGHGDLQAEDIFCLPDGVRILDCIEFDDRLRFADVCADVAFLVMDLERLGRPDSAGEFLCDYERVTGDRFPDSLLHHYCASRAYVRAKVECLRAEQGSVEATAEACRLHRLALHHLQQAQPRLVLVGGLPGAGKSTAAAGTAERTGWAVLRSDVVRRELTPTSTPTERYSAAVTARTYGELMRLAEELLGQGRTVLLDASFVDAAWRGAAAQAAARTHSEVVELCCQAPTEHRQARITHRLSEGTDVSEATPAVATAMAEAMDPWPSGTVIDTSGPTGDAVDRILDVLSYRDLRHGSAVTFGSTARAPGAVQLG